MSAARLKIAVQKSGRLTDHSLALLNKAGLTLSRGRDALVAYGENLPIDVMLVRDDDIPALVRDGICDLGVVGGNVAREDALEREAAGESAGFTLARELDFGRCRLALAVPEDYPWAGPASLAGRRIATSYPALLADYLRREAIDAEIVVLSGAVEIAPKLGRADLICDLVSSGATLAANRLRDVADVLESRAVVIRAEPPLPAATDPLLDRLLRRIDGVQQVAESKYIMLHAPRSRLDEIRQLLPGAESPTVLPLEGRGDRVAIHAVCRESVFWETLENLKAAGASAVLVLPVEKMLA